MNFKKSINNPNYFSNICPNEYWNQFYLMKENKNAKC